MTDEMPERDRRLHAAQSSLVDSVRVLLNDAAGPGADICFVLIAADHASDVEGIGLHVCSYVKTQIETDVLVDLGLRHVRHNAPKSTEQAGPVGRKQ